MKIFPIFRLPFAPLGSSFTKKFKLSGRTICWDKNEFARPSVGKHPGEKMMRFESDIFAAMQNNGAKIWVQNGDIYEIRAI